MMLLAALLDDSDDGSAVVVDVHEFILRVHYLELLQSLLHKRPMELVKDERATNPHNIF